MSLVVPNTVEREVLDRIFLDAMTMKLFGNNVTPTGASLLADFTEIAGGGYVTKPLVPASWVKVNGDPSYNLYPNIQVWTFTGALTAPGTIYGYYVIRNTDGKYMFGQRFPSGVIPFSPIAGSIIKVLPKFTCQSAF